MDLNNRRNGKHATKPRALGLLGHIDIALDVHEHTLGKIVSAELNCTVFAVFRQQSIEVFGIFALLNMYVEKREVLQHNPLY